MKLNSIKLYVKIISIIAITLFMLNISVIPMFSASFNYPGLLENKYEVLKDTNNHIPNINEYPFTEEVIDSVSFDILYGQSKSLVQYLGEVPNNISKVGANNKLRTTNSDTIDGNKRPWSSDSSNSMLSGQLDPEDKNHISDLHVKAMIYSTPKNGFTFIMFYIMYILKVILSMPLNLLMLIKNIDMSFILDIVDSNGDLIETFNALFLFDKDGNMAPFLILMLVIYIIGIAIYAVKSVYAENSIKVVIREISFFILAAAIAGLAITGSSQSTISRWSVETITGLTNEIAASTTEANSIFISSTDNIKKDNDNNQFSFLNKLQIDTIINMQFGYPVEDLYITKNGEATNNFGISTNKAIKDTFGDNRDFTVSNNKISVDNLGYYFWAANSSVDEKNPIINGTIKNASNYRVLYVIDFLNNARKYSLLNKEYDIVNKIDTIASNIWAPNYNYGITSMFLLAVLNLALFIALIFPVLFLTIGKVTITIGVFAIAILPGLILFQKTRSTAKNIVMTYIIAFGRFIVGLLFIDITFMMINILSTYGTFGIVVSIVIAISIGAVAPKALLEINRIMQREELPFMRPVNRVINRQLVAGYDRYYRIRNRGMNKNQDNIEANNDKDENVYSSENLNIKDKKDFTYSGEYVKDTSDIKEKEIFNVKIKDNTSENVDRIIKNMNISSNDNINQKEKLKINTIKNMDKNIVKYNKALKTNIKGNIVDKRDSQKEKVSKSNLSLKINIDNKESNTVEVAKENSLETTSKKVKKLKINKVKEDKSKVIGMNNEENIVNKNAKEINNKISEDSELDEFKIADNDKNIDND